MAGPYLRDGTTDNDRRRAMEPEGEEDTTQGDWRGERWRQQGGASTREPEPAVWRAPTPRWSPAASRSGSDPDTDTEDGSLRAGERGSRRRYPRPAASTAGAADAGGTESTVSTPVASFRWRWGVWIQPVKFPSTYPDLQSFTAAVADKADRWHPIILSAGFNYAAQLNDGLEKGGDGGKSSGARRELLAAVDKLQAAFASYVSQCPTARYVVNALWVCAKLGHWGDRGSFAALLLRKLRADGYQLLWSCTGQGHGNLWWAVSELAAAGVPAEPPSLSSASSSLAFTASRSSTRDADDASLLSADTSGRSRSPSSPSSSPSSSSSSRGSPKNPKVEPETLAEVQRRESGGGSIGGDDGCGGGGGPGGMAGEYMDVLAASAKILKDVQALEHPEYTPQEMANMILASARLGYSSDPRFIAHLLRHFVDHQGPFKPQAVSNVLYALGELYGDSESYGGAAASAAGASMGDSVGAAGRGRASSGPAAAAAERPPGLLAAPVVEHVRKLMQLALRTGLDSFNTQELSNLAYGCAKLGVKLEVSRFEPPHSTSVMGSSSPPPPPKQGRQQGQRQGRRQRRQQQQEQQQQYEAQLAAAPEQQLGAGPAADVTLPGDPMEAAREFVSLLGAHVQDRLRAEPSAFVSQALANLAWAMATTNYLEIPFYTAIVTAALKGGRMQSAKPQEWAIFLWSLAEARCLPPTELADTLLDVAESGRCPGFASDEVAWLLTLWALCLLGQADDQALTWLAGLADPLLPRLSHKARTNALWALAQLPPDTLRAHSDLVNKVVDAVNAEPPEMYDDIGLVQLWQAHLELQAAAAASAAPQPPTPSASAPSPSASASRAAREPGLKPPGRKLAQRQRQPRKLAIGDGAATSVTAAAVTAVSPAPVQQLSPRLVHLAGAATRQQNTANPERMSVTSLQLDVAGAMLYLMVSGSGEREATTGLQSGHNGAAAAAAPPVEAAESAAPTALLSSGVQIRRVEQEWLVEELNLRVDLCVWLSDGRVVAVEVDGPTHYMRNTRHVKIPRTIMRDRQLARVFGPDNALTIPYWEWDVMIGNQGAKRDYVSSLLGLEG